MFKCHTHVLQLRSEAGLMRDIVRRSHVDVAAAHDDVAQNTGRSNDVKCHGSPWM